MNTIIQLMQGDITSLTIDAVVNAANTSLMGGSGVDGAIHRAGGRRILEECIQIGGCEVGEAVITTAGNMQAKYVIHTVGPIWHGGSQHEPELLRNAYWTSLNVAKQNNVRSIAFPNISTGVYRFPKKQAAQIAWDTTNEFLTSNPNALDKVVFICFDDENHQIYQQILDNIA